jgi:formylglycine-generating enzyme required for sulfatase activity
MARTAVRIETLTLPDSAAASVGAGSPGGRPAPGPLPAVKPGPVQEAFSTGREDEGAVARVNAQLAAEQQDAMRKLGERGITPPEGMTLVPAGEFLMGAEDGLPDARPVRSLYVSSYWIDTFEVTNAQYRRCVHSGVCTRPKDPRLFEDAQRAEHPVTNLTWLQARTYCQWNDRRLPTEAEWEKAARGIDGRQYPWGNSSEVIKARLKDKDLRNGSHGTEPVGSQPWNRSPYGVYDLVGSVWEWVKDWYAEDFYATAPSLDPQGPLRGSFRVMRGGDWSQGLSELRVSYRGWDEMTYWGPALGFRCATDVP